jgi:hypothetical protein
MHRHRHRHAREVISLGLRNARRELIATSQHAAQPHDIALLVVNINAHPSLSRLIAAYRRWLTTQAAPEQLR